MYNNNYSNFDNVFTACYEGSITIEKMITTNPARKKFFCEKVIQKFNLNPNTLFKDITVYNNDTHGTPTYLCSTKDGKEICLLFQNGYVVEYDSKTKMISNNILELGANHMIENDGRGNRMIVNFTGNEIGFIEANQNFCENNINFVKATNEQKQQFENAMSSDMNNFYQQGHFDAFFTNGLYPNITKQNNLAMWKALPMFNYCQAVGMFQNYNKYQCKKDLIN